MTTAVKVDDESKSRLEELQAVIRLKTDEKITQQELLSLLIDEAYESREELVNSFRGSKVPLSKEEKEAMQSGRVSSGRETKEDDIDEILYG
ncbi:MAG: hypothetical protein ABEK59_06965 [Halobacteria archaeon]